RQGVPRALRQGQGRGSRGARRGGAAQAAAERRHAADRAVEQPRVEADRHAVEAVTPPAGPESRTESATAERHRRFVAALVQTIKVSQLHTFANKAMAEPIANLGALLEEIVREDRRATVVFREG